MAGGSELLHRADPGGDFLSESYCIVVVAFGSDFGGVRRDPLLQVSRRARECGWSRKVGWGVVVEMREKFPVSIAVLSRVELVMVGVECLEDLEWITGLSSFSSDASQGCFHAVEAVEKVVVEL